MKNNINMALIHQYNDNLSKIHKNFNSKKFLQIENELLQAELKARTQLVAQAFWLSLGLSYEKAMDVLLKMVEKGNFKGFAIWPVTEFIQKYGIDHEELSFKAMCEVTPRFTAEFAVRPFIIKNSIKMYERLLSLTTESNEHLRRFASEGTRPRLPWSMQLSLAVKDPAMGIKILEKLKYDPHLYVRKSVANHLNDISKDHPDLVVELLKEWQENCPDNYTKEFNFLCNRALRTLVKDGHKGALSFFKVDSKGLITEKFKIAPLKIKMGQNLNFSFYLTNQSKNKKRCIVDFALELKRQNNKTGRKVFKLKNVQLAPGESLLINKKYSFKAITTRKYYSGRQKLDILLNGQVVESKSFLLID